MGLGKTIQVIAWLVWLYSMPRNADDLSSGAGVTKPTLVVAPTSTLTNWAREVQRFAPHIPVLVHHGEKSARHEALASLMDASARPRSKAVPPVVVTSYQLAINDKRQLSQHAWAAVVVDEGHRLKSLHSTLKRDLVAIANAQANPADPCMRVLLTGTPLQNDMMELWSLCNFVMPRIFSNPDEFARVYSFFALETKAGQAAVLARQRKDSVISKLHELLARYLLRHTKAQVHLELPPKVEAVVFCPLTSAQRALSAAALDERPEDGIEALGWRHDPAQHGALGTSNRPLLLRKVVCHPWLLGEPTDLLESGGVDERIVLSSGKLLVLDRMLAQLTKAGHKVLIFSQWVRVLRILQDFLSLRVAQFGLPADGYLPMIVGSMSMEERQEAIDRFNGEGEYDAAEAAKHPVALLSTRAGGLGINLTGADTVIIFDSDWNPTGDSQAEDRAHRIGQTKAVAVYRLVSDRSIELDQLSRANAKRALERMVLQDGVWAMQEQAANAAAGASAAALTPAKASGKEARTPSPDTGKAGSPGEAPQTGEFGVLPEALLRVWLRQDVDVESRLHAADEATTLAAMAGNKRRRASSVYKVGSSELRWPEDLAGGISEEELAKVLVRQTAVEVGEAVNGAFRELTKAATEANDDCGVDNAVLLKQAALTAPLEPEGEGYVFVVHGLN